MDSSSFDAPDAKPLPGVKPPTIAMTRLGQVLTIALALFGGALGAVLVESGTLAFSQLPAEIPAPHVVPKSSGGTALSLAMIDDILCERFDRPGVAWHAARIRLRQASIDAAKAKLQPGTIPPADYLADLDDLSASYDLSGQAAKGIAVQEEKLDLLRSVEKAWIERQLAVTAAARSESTVTPKIPEMPDDILALYRSYANLGTHLIHANFPAAMRGDREARSRANEGLTFLKLSVAINPDAHFGRESWQIIAGEFFLAAIDRPELLTTYDFIGDRWLQGPPPQEARVNKPEWPATYARLADPLATLEELRRPDAVDDPDYLSLREDLRKQITDLGAEGSWKGEFLTSLDTPAPFDEPTLGILGMWTLGGGANPHFALALGGICERVGQEMLAWRAYERATMLADRFSADAEIKAKFVAHCKERQQALLPILLPKTGPADLANQEEVLRKAFQTELKVALAQRAEREKFEEQQVAAGVSPDDPQFYKPWNDKYPSLHTTSSYLDRVESGGATRRSTPDLLAGTLLLAGAGALLGQLIARYAFRA